MIWLFSWIYIFFQLCPKTEQICQVHKIQKKLCKSHCCRSNRTRSKVHCFFYLIAQFKVATFLFFAAVWPGWQCICVTYFCWVHVLLECDNSKVGKVTKRCGIVIHNYIISRKTTFSPNLDLVEEETLGCLPILQH